MKRLVGVFEPDGMRFPLVQKYVSLSWWQQFLPLSLS